MAQVMHYNRVGLVMHKANEYREHAGACRKMAADPLLEAERRAMLLNMAQAWDRLAHERRSLLELRERLEPILGPPEMKPA